MVLDLVLLQSPQSLQSPVRNVERRLREYLCDIPASSAAGGAEGFEPPKRPFIRPSMAPIYVDGTQLGQVNVSAACHLQMLSTHFVREIRHLSDKLEGISKKLGPIDAKSTFSPANNAYNLNINLALNSKILNQTVDCLSYHTWANLEDLVGYEGYGSHYSEFVAGHFHQTS